MRFIAETAARYLRKRGYLVVEEGGPQMIVKRCLVHKFSDHLVVYPLQGSTKGMTVGVFLYSQLLDCTDPSSWGSK
jgi:hypothetical protein